MYVVTVVFEVVPGQEQAFAERVLQQARDSLNLEPGCHVFTVSRAVESATRFFLYEEYSSESAFSVHLKSEHFVRFSEAVEEMVENKAVEIFSRIG